MNSVVVEGNNERMEDLTVDSAANQRRRAFRLSRRASIPKVSSASSRHNEEASMIRHDREYQEAMRRVKDDQNVITEQRAALESTGLTSDEVERGMGPALSFHAGLVEDVAWYERVCRRDFETIQSLSAIGRLLIAARIANGLTQQELADRLGVSAAQVSRDERNDYHGITVDRAQLILDRLGETLTARLVEKPLARVS